ncbi:Zinc finger, C2CH-type [Cinara cedri]|uniref:Zinc finger, C2CH-type n=1 Tax=Cinara cedri TaxID=506608 RepID=A0A5E4NGC3_9HEMI|nr:Zinc finger, C2CH-type [Cinara cedri]
MVSTCALCYNNSKNNKNVSFHCFPKDVSKKTKWLKALNLTSVSNWSKICSYHFSANDFRFSNKRNVLQSTAVPTSNYKRIEEEHSYVNKRKLFKSNPTNIRLGGGKARKIITDPIVDKAVNFIRPNTELFHRDSDDNFKGISNQMTTDPNDFDDDIVDNFAINEKVPIISDTKEEIVTIDDWSQSNPAMLKTPISAVLRQPQLSTQIIPFTSSFSLYTETLEDMQPAAATTPNQMKTMIIVTPQKGNKNDVSGRKPSLTTSASNILLKANVSTLHATNMDVREEHKLQMKILKLQEQQEVEKLKQETIKTEMLKVQFQCETGVEWDIFDATLSSEHRSESFFR